MEALRRLGRVPWLRRIAVALGIVGPVLLLLYIPPVAAATIFGICLLAANEHCRLKSLALQRLLQHTAAAAAADTNSKANEIQKPLLASRLSSPKGVSFGVAANSVLLYGWSRDIPESRDALLYAWASAGLDLYFLWHYAVPLAMGSFVLQRNGGLPLAASLIAISAAGDSGALFCGSAFGKRKIIEKLSPNKTVAGVLGSLSWSWLAGWLLWLLSLKAPYLGLRVLSLAEYLCFATLISISGFFGDLVESGFKRLAGAKDSSGLFGPHGGVLDRLDSMTLPIPFLVFFMVLRGHL
ncbi:Phosphatidate cytidylyltransferase, related [Eimeria tenella]|uniref:Phosphatidate cytidylyltransferase n=1 Tax=Eimeria tenella TaxID=5802 RepID=U6L621_EIMTE|nr:Phosphatidate cytidylyltransferase, related [Eimeria tenella]CDJ44648.1 Phosphatidate cytidylyltransferase, related [Eimeria tenella]|eukprot:XP_013235396.1 Phosphatidate cytidylyltransferase, related [Eimeria tenella]